MPADLFGQPITEASLVAKPKGRPRTGRPWAGGYATHPGSGPAGESCGTCTHRVRLITRSGKVFQKCGLMRAVWTSGPGGDIKCKTAACLKWAPELEAPLQL